MAVSLANDAIGVAPAFALVLRGNFPLRNIGGSAKVATSPSGDW